jgi:hypothetical protein
MPRMAHRVAPNRLRELRERAWAVVATKLAGKIICPRCRCTFKTNNDLCTAELDDRCPGFDAIDKAYMEACREVGLT